MAKDWRTLPEVTGPPAPPAAAVPKKDWRALPVIDDEPGVLPTIGHHLEQGFWKGWSDEGVGAIGRALAPSDANARIEVKGGPSIPTTDRAGVQEALAGAERSTLAKQSKAHPYWSFMANLAGDVGSDAVLRALGVPVDNPIYATLAGAVSGAGRSEAKDAGGVAGDAATSAALSLAGDTIGRQVVPRLAKAVAQPVKGALQDFAAKRAVKATGAIQNNIKGIPEKKLLETGRVLLDQGIIRPGHTAADVGERASEALERLGPAVGETLKRADESAAAKAIGPGVTRLGRTNPFDWSRVLGRIDDEVLKDSSVLARDQAAGVVDQVERAASEGGGFQAANRLKSDIQDGAFSQADPKLKQRLARQVQGIVKDEVDSQLESELGEQVGQEFRDAKKLYGAMSNAEKWSQRGVERATGNRFLSAGDQGSMGAQYAGELAKGRNELQALPKAYAFALLAKLARERGASTLAVGANELAKANPLRALASAQSGASKLTSSEIALLRQWLAERQKEQP